MNAPVMDFVLQTGEVSAFRIPIFREKTGKLAGNKKPPEGG
jgi:hypothetical protein